MKKSILVFGIIMTFVAAGLLLPGLIGAGSLEPSGPPGPTMKTLDEIPPTWSQKLDASERFELVLDGGAVLDKETGLVWAKDANIAGGTKTWLDAIIYCRNISIADRKGWRLPTVDELASLIDLTQSDPALPAGHPFINVQSNVYWSSSTNEGDNTSAWVVVMSDGTASNYYDKAFNEYVWPVRSGQ